MKRQTAKSSMKYSDVGRNSQSDHSWQNIDFSWSIRSIYLIFFCCPFRPICHKKNQLKLEYGQMSSHPLSCACELFCSGCFYSVISNLIAFSVWTHMPYVKQCHTNETKLKQRKARLSIKLNAQFRSTELFEWWF